MKNRTRRAVNPNPLTSGSPFDNLCRTCLATTKLVSIFGSESSTQKKTDDLRLVTGLEIKPRDGLSQKMCKKCLKIVHRALEFRVKSKNAEVSLRRLSLNRVTRNFEEKANITQRTVEVEVLGPEDTARDAGAGSIKDVTGGEELMPQVNDYSIDFFDDHHHNDDVLPKGVEDKTGATEPIIWTGYQPGTDEQKQNTAEKKSKIWKKPGPKRKYSKGLVDKGPYVCGYCSKEFAMRSSYSWHLRTHSSKFICEECGKQCRSNYQLKEHKRAIHDMTRIHKCAFCAYTSATKEALTIHERLHTGEKPYECDYCGSAFHRRSNLVQHIAIHLKEKKFKCELCGKQLKSRKFLQIHTHNSHTGRRYSHLCPLCGRGFEKPNKARAHCRRAHGLRDDGLPRICRVPV